MNENVWIAFIVCVCLIVCILIVVLYFRSRNMHKERLLKHSQQHEINMVKEEFNNKKEWEEIINTHLKENKATKEELEESFELGTENGLIVGKTDNQIITLPNETRHNKNVAVFGASGSRKSRRICNTQYN